MSPVRVSKLSLVAMLALGACKSTAAPTPPVVADAAAPQTAPTAAEQFVGLRDEILGGYYDLFPARAVEMGLHAYDGKLRDSSADGLALELEFIEGAIGDLEAVDAKALDPLQRVELGTLLVGARGQRFELKTRRAPWRDPMFYLPDVNLTPYIARDYAPLPQRARAVIAIATGAEAHLAHAATNLEPNLPRTWLDTALLQVRGTIAFAKTDVPAAMAGLPEADKADLDAALASMVTALTAYEAALVERQKTATDDFALGAENFVAMLRETQGIDIDLARLQAIGQRDLQRNLAAMEVAAKEIAPKANVRKTILKVSAEKPAPGGVLGLASEQAAEMRAFLVDEKLVTIPSEDIAKVTVSPPFMRWNAAFLDPAGAFETGALPSFYYISPPDPAWPKKKQLAYVPGETDLLFITIHEVWPGHFLHGLHVKAQPSKVLKSYWNYAMGEGWAHYTEEMMWDAGVSDDPKVHIGQLQNALLRNVRYMSAIGLHTGTMTVEQSHALFRDQAYQDEANAQQQAVRGTFDPMYLSYTLGKLIILKLRDDMQAKAKAEGRPFTLGAFHDELLSYGAAPLPVIREAMLGPDAGPVL
jgi:uncharacterized protein (DUF885 family)